MHNRRLLVLAAISAVAMASLGASAIAQEISEAPPEADTGLKKVSKAPKEAAPTPQTATAEDQPDGTEGESTQVRRPPGGFLEMMRQNPLIFVLFGGMILLFFWTSRSKRKQETKRREMLASLKKGDKVTSIGGVVGTIVEVREDEVTVKVDENNNIRMKFARWAIRGLGDQAKTEAPEDRR